MEMCTKMKIYLAGPMSGYKDFNFPQFRKYAKQLRKQGHAVFSPAEADLVRWGSLAEIAKKATYRKCLATDLNWILRHAEGIAMMPGWKKSKGARVELHLAQVLGLEEIYLDG
jgi:hypothetical protein